MTSVPRVNGLYWLSLTAASIFGANLGDFLSDVLHLGHINGLPFLVAMLAGILILATRVKENTIFLFWVAVIVIRAAATNIGDSFHDFNIGFAWSVPGVFLALLLVTLFSRITDSKPGNGSQIPVNSLYWISMILAGTLGTVAGDYLSYPAGLGNFRAMILAGVVTLGVLGLRWRVISRDVFSYWLVIALIRTTGTAGGDLLANRVFGLSLSTAVTGVLFAILIFLIYGRSKQNTLSKTAPDSAVLDT